MCHKGEDEDIAYMRAWRGLRAEHSERTAPDNRLWLPSEHRKWPADNRYRQPCHYQQPLTLFVFTAGQCLGHFISVSDVSQQSQFCGLVSDVSQQSYLSGLVSDVWVWNCRRKSLCWNSSDAVIVTNQLCWLLSLQNQFVRFLYLVTFWVVVFRDAFMDEKIV